MRRLAHHISYSARRARPDRPARRPGMTAFVGIAVAAALVAVILLLLGGGGGATATAATTDHYRPDAAAPALAHSPNAAALRKAEHQPGRRYHAG